MFKRFSFLTALFVILVARCFSQETIEKKNKLNGNISETYHVLANNPTIKQGLYQAIFKKKIAIASGMYNNNQKTGLWRFYNSEGQTVQIYDYTKKQLLLEAPEDTTSSLRYFADLQLDSTSHTTKPIKIGGRYYGYLPYLNLFVLPKDLRESNYTSFMAVVELLISPYGRLADYKVHLSAYDFERNISMNINLPNPEDMTFIPATLNGEPIACRIAIKCHVNNSGHLEFD